MRKARVPFIQFMRQSKDPTVKTVLSEDAAALAGLMIALVGTALAQLTARVTSSAPDALLALGDLARELRL